MDYNRLTQLLESDDICSAEIVTYHYTKKGLIRKTTTIDYFGHGDYQWSTTTKPITTE